MSTPVPNALRWAVRRRRRGWRLLNAPGGWWSLLTPVGWVLALVIAAALQTVLLILLLLVVSLASRHGIWFGLLALPALAIGGSISVGGLKLGWAALVFACQIHRIDFRLDVARPKVVASGWIGWATVRLADLTEVILQRCYEGELELSLNTEHGGIACRVSVISPLLGVDPEALTAWLGEILARWEVPVRNRVIEPYVEPATGSVESED